LQKASADYSLAGCGVTVKTGPNRALLKVRRVKRSSEMIALRFGRYALGVCVALAMLAGCGGNIGNGVMPTSAAPNTFPYHKSFFYTGAAQDFKVPANIFFLWL
jgi:hypothetical protein